MAGVGRITLSERPTRVAVAAASALGAGCYPSVAGGWAAAGAAGWALLGGVGIVQLLAAIRRELR